MHKDLKVPCGEILEKGGEEDTLFPFSFSDFKFSLFMASSIQTPVAGFERLLSKLSPKAAQELGSGPGLTLAYALPTAVEGVVLQDTHLQVHVRPKNLRQVLRYLRDEESLQYTTLTAMNVVDRPTAELRFGVVYQLLSYTLEHRLQVICLVDDH